MKRNVVFCRLCLVAIVSALAVGFSDRAWAVPAEALDRPASKEDADFERQIEMGRLHWRLEQELELTKRLRAMLDILKQLQPHAAAIETLFADTPGTRVLLDALTRMGTGVTRSERAELVFAEIGRQRAILRVGGRYLDLERGESLTLDGVDYQLDSVGAEGVGLRSSSGELRVPWTEGARR